MKIKIQNFQILTSVFIFDLCERQVKWQVSFKVVEEVWVKSKLRFRLCPPCKETLDWCDVCTRLGGVQLLP